MALETLKKFKKIGEYEILQDRVLNEDGSVNWAETDIARKDKPIYIDHDVNMISFRMQAGPIKEKGVNGCQVDTLILAALYIIEGLNEQYRCRENSIAITKLEEALHRLEDRKKDRELRGVEGYSKE